MKWFNDIKIRNKLIFVFGLMLAITVFFAVFAIAGIKSVGNNLNDLIDSYQARQSHIERAIGDIYKIRLTTMSTGYLVEEDLKQIITELNSNHESNITMFKEDINAFKELVLTDPRLSEEEKQLRLDIVKDITILFDRYVMLTNRLHVAAIFRDKESVVNILVGSIPVGTELSDRVHDLLNLASITIQEKANETQRDSEYMQSVFMIISIMLIALSMLVLAFTIRNINRPISQLEKAVDEIAGGNLAYPIRTDRKDELGTLAGCIGNMVDELVNYNKVQDALKTAELASASKSSFLANMSHEIRTPMNAILGVTEILLQDTEMDPDLRESLNKIYSSGDLLLSIINDILDLSKIEAGKLELSPARYEVASLINDTVSLNMMRIGSKPIEFKLMIDEETPASLFGDDLRIKQILNNLLSNAFKYTQKGLVELMVAPEESDEDGVVSLVFSVRDTGLGMSEAQLEKLFDEYARFNDKANRATEGTGLGMSITYKLINLMEGHINVESVVDQGSVFTVYIPQEKTDSNILGKELAESLQSFQLSDSKQIRKAQISYEPMPYGSVLIVDDVESNIYVAKGLMAPYELQIDTASSGYECLDKIEDGAEYDIVFMDHMMPKMDGMETALKLREMGYALPIVALTANAVVGQSDIFLANGFDAFISKPIDMRQLSSVLKQYLRDKKPPEVVEAARKAAVQKNVETEKKIDPALMNAFIRDANKSILVLNEIYARGEYPDGDVRSYTINVHAMKSALANIGEPILSNTAAHLENAGRENDIATISDETPGFISELKAVVDVLAPLAADEKCDEAIEEDFELLSEKLLAIINACEGFDKKGIKAALGEINLKKWSGPVNEQLGDMTELLLEGDFEAVAKTAYDMISGL